VARWEAFRAKPSLTRLLDLWDVTPGRERAQRMRTAAEHVKAYLAHPPRSWKWLEDGWDEENAEAPVWIERSLLAHAYLLAGKWNAAQQLAARDKSLGWSSGDSAQGLVVAFFLLLLAGKSAGRLPSNLMQLWQWALEYSTEFDAWNSADHTTALKRLERTYGEVFANASLKRNQQEHVLSWCMLLAEKRVKAIVGGQHRGSYDKAATLLGACMEVLRSRGQQPTATELLERVRNRFPRHRAFQALLP
jgi:hypothetical protein